jgi:hypothetical protein
MTQLHLIYVASIVGAALFFIAGAASAALRRRAPVPATAHAVPAVSSGHDAELAALRRERSATLEAAGKELVTARAAARRAEAHAAQLAEELAAARTARKQDAANTAASTATQAAADSALRAVTDRAIHAEARATRLAGELERARGETTGAAGEVATLQARVLELERQLAERTSAARDLSTENEQLKGRLRDAEGLRADYVRLRTTATDAEFLRSEVERLEGELRAMHVEALSISRPRPARGSVQPPSASKRTISESLAITIDRFADDGTRSIAVADAMGFPLASNGADGVALAAYAALLMESASKSRQFLPVAAPAGIEVVDERGTRMSVWTFDVDGDRLLLANLAVTPVDTRRLETTLADLSAILAHTQPASHTG